MIAFLTNSRPFMFHFVHSQRVSCVIALLRNTRPDVCTCCCQSCSLPGINTIAIAGRCEISDFFFAFLAFFFVSSFVYVHSCKIAKAGWAPFSSTSVFLGNFLCWPVIGLQDAALVDNRLILSSEGDNSRTCKAFYGIAYCW